MATLRRSSWAVLCLLAVLALPHAAAAAERFLSPGAGEALAPGSIVEVRWLSLCQSGSVARGVDEAEIVLSLDGGLSFPVRVSHELSPCEARFLWRVPMLPSGRARLALRAGSEGRDETEALTFVSGEFRILTDLDGRVQQLLRRAAEWWTPPEPTVLTTEDLLGRTMFSSDGRLAVATLFPDEGVPPDSWSLRPVAHRNPRIAADSVTRTVSPVPPTRPSDALTPLRL